MLVACFADFVFLMFCKDCDIDWKVGEGVVEGFIMLLGEDFGWC